MEDAAGRELLSALDDRDPTIIRAAMVSYADRVQGVRLQAKAYDLVAQQHGQSAPWTVPQLGSCASSGRAWRPGQLGTPSHCLGCWSQPPPDSTSFYHLGAAERRQGGRA